MSSMPKNQIMMYGNIETITGTGESQQRVYFGDKFYTFTKIRKHGKHVSCNNGMVAV